MSHPRFRPIATHRCKSVYSIESDVPGKPLVIRDVGHETHASVTTDAGWVVYDLVQAGLLPEGRRLLYYDSEGTLDEILVKNGRFAGFAPGPREGIAR